MAKGSRGGKRRSGGGGVNPADIKSTRELVTQRGAGGYNIQDMITAYNGSVGDYDGNGNPALQRWQQMSDDDIGHYLHGVASTDLTSSQYDDGYGFYDNSFQKFVLANNLNDPITVMDDADFNAYVKATNQSVFYRGWSSQRASDRLVNASNFHSGNGIYGDGIYMAKGSESTARGYGSYFNAYALSPNARVVNHSQVQAKIRKLPRKTQKSLSYAGGSRDKNRSYGTNNGESQMALKMGYNVIRVDRGSGTYYVALTRDALVQRKSNVK